MIVKKKLVGKKLKVSVREKKESRSKQIELINNGITKQLDLFRMKIKSIHVGTCNPMQAKEKRGRR